MLSKVNSLDSLDLQILTYLSRDARVTWAELAKHLQLSAPAVAERVRKLEENGVIDGYQVQLNASALGQNLLAFVAVSLRDLRQRQALLRCITQHHAILECHHTTGSDDYFLKVRVGNTTELEALLTNELKRVAPSVRTHSTIVLSSLKETVLQVQP